MRATKLVTKKKQQKSAPLEPPQESCSRCGDPIVLKVTSKSEKNKGKRYWSCQAHSREGHFFEWWRVPGDLATRLSKTGPHAVCASDGGRPTQVC
jgi:hypothetical protein